MRLPLFNQSAPLRRVRAPLRDVALPPPDLPDPPRRVRAQLRDVPLPPPNKITPRCAHAGPHSVESLSWICLVPRAVYALTCKRVFSLRLALLIPCSGCVLMRETYLSRCLTYPLPRTRRFCLPSSGCLLCGWCGAGCALSSATCLSLLNKATYLDRGPWVHGSACTPERRGIAPSLGHLAHGGTCSFNSQRWSAPRPCVQLQTDCSVIS